MDIFDVLILVISVVVCVTLFALGFPFYEIIVYYVAITLPIGMILAIIFGIANWVKKCDEEG